jgi:hypothetical protein
MISITTTSYWTLHLADVRPCSMGPLNPSSAQHSNSNPTATAPATVGGAKTHVPQMLGRADLERDSRQRSKQVPDVHDVESQHRQLDAIVNATSENAGQNISYVSQ